MSAISSKYFQESSTAAAVVSSDDDWVFPMLDEISRHSAIWNKSEDDHRLTKARKEAWTQVQKFVEDESGYRKTIEVLRRRWRFIRDAWKSRQRQPMGESGKRKISKYDEALEFLIGAAHNPQIFTNQPAPTFNDVANPLVDWEDFRGPEASRAFDAPNTSQRRNRQTANDGAVLEEVRRSINSLNRGAAPTSLSEHEEYGRLVIKGLDRVKNTPAYRPFLEKLTKWIVECQCYTQEDHHREGE